MICPSCQSDEGVDIFVDHMRDVPKMIDPEFKCAGNYSAAVICPVCGRQIRVVDSDVKKAVERAKALFVERWPVK